jgi:nicotinamidase-related amidase
VIDCQNDFIDGSLRNEDAIKAVPNIVKKINEFNGDYILVTMDTHEENYLETNEGKKLPVVHCIKDTDGWKINKDIAKAIQLAEGRNNGN